LLSKTSLAEYPPKERAYETIPTLTFTKQALKRDVRYRSSRAGDHGLFLLAVFGPKKLPGMARDFGRFISGACDAIEEFKDELVPEGVRRRL
jgi:hypothetical protein